VPKKKFDDATKAAEKAAKELEPYEEELARRLDRREAATTTEPAQGAELIRPAPRE